MHRFHRHERIVRRDPEGLLVFFENQSVVVLPNNFDLNIWLIHHQRFSVRHRPVIEQYKQKVRTKS